MPQELEFETPKMNADLDNDAITICKNCKKLVPKTMLCLYCGGHLLFKKPKNLHPR